MVWIKSIGGLGFDVGRSLVTDNNDNIFITGYFNGTVDFDPNLGVVSLTANGPYDDIFVLKLNPNGDLLWVKQVGGASFEEGLSIAIDSNDNVYTTGYFSGTLDFDPGPGVYTLTSDGIFIQKLDNDGNFVWARNMIGGTGFTRGKSITIDSNNDIYVAGDFESTVDFDPGPGVSNLTANGIDAFIVKLNSNGQFLWAKQLGGDHSDILFEITIDYNDNIYATGYFIQSADFDPGPGVVNLTNGYSPDIYVLKLNSDGEFLWVRQFGDENSQNRGTGVATDLIGNVFITGTFADTIDFNPGPDTNNLTASGYSDSFVLKLDPNGDFVWAQQVGGDNSTVGKSIAVDHNIDGNDIIVSGAHRATIDIDPTIGVTNLTSNGFNDFFVLKLFDPLPLCTNLSSPLDGATDVSVSSNLTWNSIANATGYYLSVGTSSGGMEIAGREDVGNTTTYDPPADFAENQYIYVTITPYNCVGEAIACSEESFLTETTSLPPCTGLNTPIPGAVDIPVSSNLTWNATVSAAGYFISIGTTMGGTEITDREDVGNLTTYDPVTDFPENQDIYVTVIPYNSVGEAIGCTEESFRTEAVITVPSCTRLNAPLNNTDNIPVSSNLTWIANSNATGYFVSIGTTMGGTEITDREDVRNLTTYDPVTDFPENQDIYVTVIPYNSIGEAIGCTEESFRTEGGLFVIPKFFTPNNDGHNDLWQIGSITEYPNAAIYIFDRYGKLLARMSSQSNGWDGTFNDQPLPSSDYWFKVNLDNGNIISGHFTLKR